MNEPFEQPATAVMTQARARLAPTLRSSVPMVLDQQVGIMERDEELLRLLNASGFAFQLGVEKLLESAEQELYCQILATEHPWRHVENDRSGFIDLVLDKHIARIVVECKKTKDAKWLFLVPSEAGKAQIRFKCHWHLTMPAPSKGIIEWDDISIMPASPESSFCSVRGSGDGQITFLDRIGGELVAASEALSRSEMSAEVGSMMAYIPMVVTNAQLMIGHFDPATMNSETGAVEAVGFEEVGFLRYRKPLDTAVNARAAGIRDLGDANSYSQRSILVVNVQHLDNLLRGMEIKPLKYDVVFPWDRAHEKRLGRG